MSLHSSGVVGRWRCSNGDW